MAKTPAEINAEIEQTAEKLSKSVKSSKEVLFDTILELGPEGLKKAAATLTDGDKQVLASALEEMKKAAGSEMTPKKDETTANAMKQESNSGSDDEDEKKLMNEKNAAHSNQGGPKDKPEGWDGQVIKAADLKPEEKAAVKKLIPMEEKEHGKDLNGDGKVGEEKEPKMKKSLEEIVGMAKSLKMTKEEVVKAIQDAGQDLELVKAEMKKKMLKEEEQVKMAGQDKGKDAPAAAPAPNLEQPHEETADEVKAPMMKSVAYSPKSSIAANTLGRNTHWDVDAYIVKSEEEKQDTIKKGAYFNETQGETLKKSEKADLNDLIEKGFDYSTEEVLRLEGIKNHKNEGKIVKSFHDIDIARALGMTDEEYKKLMGE